MSLRSFAANRLRPVLRRYPRLKSGLDAVDRRLLLWHHAAATRFPGLIRPEPIRISISVTASCNLRCMACNYGRDFMPKQQLPYELVCRILDDASSMGFVFVQLYGGEPLLHPDLPRIVEYATDLGLSVELTTNGVLLRDRVGALYDAGLRTIGFGFYGVGEAYDSYVQRRDRFARLESGISHVRERYGSEMRLAMGWLLMRPTCNTENLRDAWSFAERYSVSMEVALIHYSFPYFNEGADREFQFFEADRPAIQKVVSELLALKQSRPDLLANSVMGLRSIPDWLLRKTDMRVPCHRYRNIWVGPDGTVHVCVGTEALGNVHESRLADLLMTPHHKKVARDCYALNCPNCHVGFDERIQVHGPARAAYGGSGASHPAVTSRVHDR